MITHLEYYSKIGTVIKFDNYTIDDCGVIRNEKGKPISYRKNKNGYTICSVYDVSGKQRSIYVGRAIASAFFGPPPTPRHTADHIDRNRYHDTLDNIRWLDETGQKYNQDRSGTLKNAFLIVKDGMEKTIKEWVEYLKGEKNHMMREYTVAIIRAYAQRKQFGFSYKKYPDLPEEVWKEVICSSNDQGHWHISNMNRVKYVTTHAENVISGDRLGLSNGYPNVFINGKNWLCHILVFKTFFPNEWDAKKPDEMVLHEDDDKMDFRPHKLRIGTRSENAIDAHDNGCHDGTKTSRIKS